MTGEAFRDGMISMERMTTALMTTRGDLFLAASYLGVTPRELDLYIRANSELQVFTTAIREVKLSPEYDQMSQEQFAAQLTALNMAYRLEATDEIYQMAMMPMPESAAMMDVKLKAALALRGAPEEKRQGSEQAMVMAELNALYQQSAPRIKSIRVAQIEYQSGT